MIDRLKPRLSGSKALYVNKLKKMIKSSSVAMKVLHPAVVARRAFLKMVVKARIKDFIKRFRETTFRSI